MKEVRRKIKKAPLNKRIFAYALDWYFGWMLCVVPAGYLWNVTTGKLEINADLTLFEQPFGIIAGLLGLLFGVLYYYVIPLKSHGQTLGKKFLSIRVADENGKDLSPKDLAKRQILGVMLLESSFMLTGNYVCDIISIFTAEMVGTALSWVMVATFLVSCFMTVKSGKAIHDILGHSIVIEK